MRKQFALFFKLQKESKVCFLKEKFHNMQNTSVLFIEFM